MDRITLRPFVHWNQEEPFRLYYHPGPSGHPSCSRRGVSWSSLSSNSFTALWTAPAALPDARNADQGASRIDLPGGKVLLKFLIPHHKHTVFDLVFERVHWSGRGTFQHLAVGIKCAFVTRTLEDSQVLLPVIDGVVQVWTDSAENGNRPIRVTAEPDRPVHLLIDPAPMGCYRDLPDLESPYGKFLNISRGHPFIDRAFPAERKITDGQR